MRLRFIGVCKARACLFWNGMREYGISAGTDLRSVVAPEVFDRLCALGTNHSYAKGGVIYHQGDLGEHIHMLLRGKVKSVHTASNGQEVLLRIHLPGSLLGLFSLSSMRIHDASASALEYVETVAVTRRVFIRYIESEPTFGVSLTRLMLDRLREFHSRLSELQAQTVEKRLAKTLLALQADTGEANVGVLLTHEELANLVNAQRQTVTALLNHFARLKLIRKVGRRIVVLDTERLSRVVA